jgi:serine/threonine protein phosphatase PrpC
MASPISTPSNFPLSFESFEKAIEPLCKHPILPEAIEGLDTLFVYLSNLINSPLEVKYHTISALNIHFHERLGHFYFGSNILATIGYSRSTHPILHYKFNQEFLAEDNISFTTHFLQQCLTKVETLREKFNQKFRFLPQLPLTSQPLHAVTGAGRFADRGRRATMEDQEALMDLYFGNINDEILNSFSYYFGQKFAQKGNNNENNEHIKQIVSQLLPKYEDLSYFAVFDGHGGTETAEFALKFLHQSIIEEFNEYIRLQCGLPVTPHVEIKQQQQYAHITDQFLKKLPQMEDIQDVPTDDTNQTDYSGATNFMFFEKLTQEWLQSSLKLTPKQYPQQMASSTTIKYSTHPYFELEKNPNTSQLMQKFKTTPLPPQLNHTDDSTASLTAEIATKLLQITPSRALLHAMFQAHVRTDNQLRRCLALHSGCTTVTSILGRFCGQRFIITANCGDSRAVLSTQAPTCCHYASLPRYNKPHIYFQHQNYSNKDSNNISMDEYLAKLEIPLDKIKAVGNNQFQFADTYLPKTSRPLAQRLTLDHKPSIPNETSRISNLGGFVSSNGRTMGVLAVSRALGDHGLKNTRHFVSSQPHIDLQCISDPLDNVIQHPFLLLACDGVWDVMKDQDAISFISGCAAISTRLWLQHHGIKVCMVENDITKREFKGENPYGERKEEDNQDNQSNENKNNDDDKNEEIRVLDWVDYSAFHYDVLEHTPLSPQRDEMVITSKNIICHTCLQKLMPKTIVNSIMEVTAQRLVELALLNGSTDNVTVMSIRL